MPRRTSLARAIWVQVTGQVEDAAEIWGLLKGGKGVFYVCGDAKHMAKDVNRALRQVIEKERGCSTEESEICLQDLIHQKRYLRDVW